MAHVARPEVVVLGRVRPGHGAVLDRALARHFLSRTGAPGRVARAGWAIIPHFLPSPGTTQCQKRRSPRACRPSTATACSRSEEHTSELQSLMRNSYAVFCLKKKN